MKKLLWLDDCRDPAYNFAGFNSGEYEVHWVKDFWAFKKWLIDNGLPDVVSFDYSLGSMDYDGTTCVRSMISYCLHEDKEFPTYAIHSTHENVYKLRDCLEKLGTYGYTATEIWRNDTPEQAAYYRLRSMENVVVNQGGTRRIVCNNGLVSGSDFPERGISITRERPRVSVKIPRNSVCGCGSGKKYKHCCGK